MDFARYKNKLEYGLSKEKKAELFNEVAEKIKSFVGTNEQYLAYEVEMKNYFNLKDIEARELYNNEECRLTELFWKDAFEELEISIDHPKAHLLRSKAWDHGHSSGYHSIFYWFGEFAEMI